MKAIVCMTSSGGIGYRNKIPWSCPRYVDFFRKITAGEKTGENAVVMGRKTFDSIRVPVRNCRNYILSKDASISSRYPDDVVFESSVENIALLELLFSDVFVIGGAEIFALLEDKIDIWYVVFIETIFPCDVRFPIDLQKYNKTILKTETDEFNQKLVFCMYYRDFRDMA